MTAIPGNFRTTGLGSMPLADPIKAVDIVLKHLPEIPFWPQLSPRGPREGMLLQFAPGLPCLKQGEDSATLEADTTECLTEFYEAQLSGDLSRFAFSPHEAAGLFALLEAAKAGPGKIEMLKGQVSGPVTIGLSVKQPDGKPLLFDEALIQATATGLGMKGAWQVQAFAEAGFTSVIFLDEPSLTGLGTSSLPLASAQAVELINLAAEPIHEAGGKVGLHICGNSDWEAVLTADIDLINFDAFGYGDNFVIFPEAIAAFLERGGVVAWGIVPTLAYEPGISAQALVDKLEAMLSTLVEAGIRPEALAAQSLVTPSCGLGSLPETYIAIMELTAEVSRIMRG